jgi:O-antigen/teichoic acid export membrane protein
MTPAAHKLLSNRVLATNTVWTLLGFVVPAIAGLLVMPALVRGFGDERFGVLTLIWTVIGYFGLFDLGLGRAVTRHVSELLVSSDRSHIGRVIRTAWLLMLGLGIAGGIVCALIVPWLVSSVVPVSPHLRPETLTSFYLVAMAIPIVVVTTGVSGVLQASQRFGLINAVRVPSGLLTFLLPLAVLQFRPALPPTIVALIALRLIVLVAYTIMCLLAVPETRQPAPFDRRLARDLLGFGGWLTVSNVVSPIMASFDRFFVSALISVVAVTYYATPAEAVSKAVIVPSALTAVLFPAFSAAFSADRARMIRLFRTGVRTVFLAQIPIAFVVICFAPEILRLWLGPTFEARSSGVLRWLMLGILINSVAFLPYTLLQGLKRADVTAKLHLIELPLYLGVLVVLIRSAGIDGAAIAWCLRVTADLVALVWLTTRLTGEPWSELFASPALPILLMLGLGAGALAPTPGLKLLATACFFAAFFATVWQWGRGRLALVTAASESNPVQP